MSVETTQQAIMYEVTCRECDGVLHMVSHINIHDLGDGDDGTINLSVEIENVEVLSVDCEHGEEVKERLVFHKWPGT